MWKKINHLTKPKHNNATHTIDIPVDSSVGWNDIKKKNLQFKTIDDPQLIDKLINERNAHHLNQAQGTPFTIEPLLSLIGQDSFTSFSQELLDGTADLDDINVSPLIKQYLTNIKSNGTTLANQTGIIPLEDFKSGYKNDTKGRQPHLREGT